MQAPDSDKLRIGMAVLGLGQYALASGDIGEMVLPEMVQIAKLTGAAVSMGIVDQDDILIVNRAQGDGHLLINMSVGSRLPIATSSAGWAYLAGLPACTLAQQHVRVETLYERLSVRGRAGEMAEDAAVAFFPVDGDRQRLPQLAVARLHQPGQPHPGAA